MGSSRFPGKVLADLAGKPLLWHLKVRLDRCREVDETVLATSDSSCDDPLAAYARELGLRVWRGSETNVLERLLEAARGADAEVLVRVTGDAPLVDPESVDLLVDAMLDAGAHFCVFDQSVPCIHEGFEVFTRAALDKLHREASSDPVAIEHTCSYFKLHPGFVVSKAVSLPERFQYRGARVSVDTPADLDFLRAVYARLGVGPGDADMVSVVDLLREEPSLVEVNSGVRQKAAWAASVRVAIRCDAGPEIGMGHLMRCLALAEYLREEHGMGVTFFMRPSALAERIVHERHHRCVRLSGGAECWGDFEKHLAGGEFRLLILDVRDGGGLEEIRAMRGRLRLVWADLDDPEPKRLVCDFVFYPPVPQLNRMGWEGFGGKLFTGWEWIVVGRQFRRERERLSAVQRVSNGVPRILVTMGGSDPAGLTLKALEGLKTVDSAFHAVFVLGPAFVHGEAFEEALGGVEYSHEVHAGVENMAEEMGRADLAVACFSGTAYELASLGIPSVLLALTKDHEESCLALESAGMALGLGWHGEVGAAAVGEAVGGLLRDGHRRLGMGDSARERVDGLGAQRISRVLAAVVQEEALRNFR
jgi:spore coat polysaccharide biosynthesis protein SpsF